MLNMDTQPIPTDPVTDEQLWKMFSGRGVDRDSAAHFRGRLERRLLINRCDACGTWHHPPKPVCPVCLSDRLSAAPVSGSGTIFMAIFLHQGPPAEGVDYSTPYPVATVELDEQPGLRFSSTVIGSSNDEIRIGRRVHLDWIDRSGVPLPVFRLDPGAGE
jgi:uncharacterized OB-fold protein